MRKRYIIVVMLLMLITLGYAVLTTNLNINGSAEINNPTWDVHFENLQLDSENTVTGTQTITNDTTVTYNVTLSEPGDKYAFTVDVVNEGSIDAMVSAITNTSLTTEQLKYLDYTVQYECGAAISTNDLLSSGITKTILVSIEFKTDIDATDLPASEVNLTLTTNITYVQNNGGVEVTCPACSTNWSKVLTSIRNGTASVGDTWCVDMGDYGVHTLRLANTSSDWEYCGNNDYSQTACGLVLEFVDIIARYNMNPSGEHNGTTYSAGWNVDGWPGSAMYQFLNDTSSTTYSAYVTSTSTKSTVTSVYNNLPQVLKDAIIDTNVISGYGSDDANGTGPSGNWKSTDKLYLLDSKEIFGTSFTLSSNTAKTYERQLDYYSNIGVSTSSYSGAIKYFTPYSTTSGSSWWLRSAGSNYTITFWIVYYGGSYYYSSHAFDNNGVSPAFRIN